MFSTNIYILSKVRNKFAAKFFMMTRLQFNAIYYIKN